MAIKYFYIDDDPLATIQETARGLSIFPDKLVVEAFQHKKWTEELAFMLDRQNEFNGLLIDWNLTKKNNDSEEADFDAEALAAQIRKSSNVDNKFKNSFPIVLCSADFSFRTILRKKPLGKGLFDIYYEKDDFDNLQEQIVNQLVALSQAYQTIMSDVSVNHLLGLKEDEEGDYRVFEYLLLLKADGKPHDISIFILSNVVLITGILIDESLLAARFGIDLKQNVEHWEELKKIIANDCAYKGVFSGGWPRWWSSKILQWWGSICGETLGSLNASERVVVINEKFGLGLSAAAKTERSTSDYFWVIDQKTKRPIALQDAILTTKDLISRVPWEEDEYFSIDTALTEDIQNIHPFDRDKVANYKTIFSRIRQRP